MYGGADESTSPILGENEMITKSTKSAPSVQMLIRRMSYLSVTGGLVVLGYAAYQESHQPVQQRHNHADGKIAATNPWRGLPGCLLLQNQKTPVYWSLANGMEFSCANIPGSQAAKGLSAPAHAKDLINAVYPLIAPIEDARASGAETVTIGQQTIAKSKDVQLTLNARRTHLGNALADCLTTANSTSCQTAQINPKRFANFYEGAGARMIALVDMRIDTGAVQTILSARSPCLDAMVNKLPLPAHCPSMPEQYTKANTWRSGNHALTNEAMWASTVKPALALALLRGGAIQTASDQQWLRTALKTSDTPAFLDRLFCHQKNGMFDSNCKPLNELARAGIDLGYTSSTGSGYDLLQGSIGKLPTPTPRWMELAPSKQANRSTWTPLILRPIEPDLLEDCARNEWSSCKGEHLAEVAAQGWGQGDSKATALTAAAAFARLGAAANAALNQKKTVTGFTPTLLSACPSPQTLAVEPRFAAAIVDGLMQTHTNGGTAHSACHAVWGASVCNKIKGIAGKTGTPTFLHDKYTVTRRMEVCNDIAVRIASIRSREESPAMADWVENARCAYAPYKWYVALVKDSAAPNAPWTRVVAVQVERSWETNGRVDSAYDKGINIAAFMAMHYIGLTQ
jgi:hypothetical protein